MSDELDTKAEIAINLLSQGAEEVHIVGTDLKVVRRQPNAISQKNLLGNTQIINIHTQTSANLTADITAYFSILRQGLRESYRNDKRLADIEKQIGQIEKELKKESPNKAKLKKYLHSLLDFSWEAFLKILPILLDKLHLTT